MLSPDEVRGGLPAELAKLVEARAGEMDSAGRADPAVLTALSRERLLAPVVPAAHGGLGLRQSEVATLAAAMNARCTTTRSLLTVQSMVATAIEKAGSRRQRERYLPLLATGERIAGLCLTGTTSGSDALDLSGATIDVDREPWRLSGRRVWVSFGQRAELLLVVATSGRGPVAVLLDTRAGEAGISRVARAGQLGMRGCEVADLEFDERELAGADVLAEGEFAVGHAVQAALDVGRFTVACGAAGMALGCLDAVVDFARSHQVRGAPLGSRQLIQEHVADLLAHAETSLAVCARAARAREDRLAGAARLAMLAKLVATRALSAASSVAVQCLGSSGVTPGSLVERAYRDARVFEIIEGTTEITKLTLADALLRTGGGAR